MTARPRSEKRSFIPQISILGSLLLVVHLTSNQANLVSRVAYVVDDPTEVSPYYMRYQPSVKPSLLRNDSLPANDTSIIISNDINTVSQPLKFKHHDRHYDVATGSFRKKKKATRISFNTTYTYHRARPSLRLKHPQFPEHLMNMLLGETGKVVKPRNPKPNAKPKHSKRDPKQSSQQSKPKPSGAKKQTTPLLPILPSNQLNVPTPIFVPSLPKSGTTTTHQYFQCGGQKSAHLTGRTDDTMFKLGRCAHSNVRNQKPVFEGCGDYDVWTDTGYVASRYQRGSEKLQQQNNVQCFYPLMDALEEVYTSYPNATFLFVVRETDAWLDSIQKYHNGFIMDVWSRCRAKGFSNLRDNNSIEDFRTFYEWHKNMIREFVQQHPSLTYVEVELESPKTGQILEQKIGISASCWGHFNKNS